VGFACDPSDLVDFSVTARLVEHGLRFLKDLPIVIPLPICPPCGGPSLPLGYLQQVTIDLPAGVAVRIADSSGQAAVVGLDNAALQVLQFQPPPFAGTFMKFGQAGVTGGGQPLGDPAANETRFYLELYAGEGVDLNQTYAVTVTLTSTIPSTFYLPTIFR